MFWSLHKTLSRCSQMYFYYLAVPNKNTEKQRSFFFYTWNMCIWWKGAFGLWRKGGKVGLRWTFRKSYEWSLKWVFHKFKHLPISKPTLNTKFSIFIILSAPGPLRIERVCSPMTFLSLYNLTSRSSYNGNLKKLSKFAQRCPKVSPMFPLSCL